jgi:Ala-tRNA(Pro) deacylase
MTRSLAVHIEQYLTNKDVWFEMILHRPTFTAQAAGRAMHVPSTEVAKSVLIKADQYLLVVVPAYAHVDFVALREELDADDVILVHESELIKHFPDCELGAVPPFGSLYGMRTMIDESLTHETEIIFCGNRHREAIRMQFHDYRDIERPQVAAIARVHEPAEAGGL